KICFESDWHIGSGAGIPGSVDRQVLRDENGLPFIPGKTLTGVLRDAAEWIAYIRQDIQKDGTDWKGVVSSLFGEQPETHGGNAEKAAAPAKIGISSAELSEDVKNYIISADKKVNISSGLYMAHPGVKIDPATGRAEKDHFFSTERVRRDCVLYANVSCDCELFDDKGKPLNDEGELLDEAIKAVRHIGGKRRRGAGECKIKWDNDRSGSPVTASKGEKPTEWKTNPDGSITLDIRLETLQPVIIARTTLGNAVKSDMEIPGSALLSYYLQDVLGPLGKDRMSKAVMNGEISVGNFLPEFDGKASMPVPLCLAEVKETGAPVNRLVTHDDLGQLKDLRTGYVTVEDNKMEYHSADNQRVIRTHNTVDDDVQRPTEKVGGLFTYEAIRAGQKFRGTLRIGEALWEKIMENDAILNKLSCDEHAIGRSRKDEYGLVRLEYVSPDETQQNGVKPQQNGSYLAVYLLSDLLLRGAAGGYSVRLDDVRLALEAALGVKLDDLPDDEWEQDAKGFKFSPLDGTHGHCVRVERRESWQGSWHLPRPSLVFFKAGSIFLFKVSGTWDEKKAQALINDGLGERRAEGYGRVLLNPPFLLNKEVTLAERKNDDGQNPKTQDVCAQLPQNQNKEDKDFAVRLALDSLRRHFRTTARHEAYDIVVKKTDPAPFNNNTQDDFKSVLWSNKPSASQFGNLREAAATMTDAENGTAIFKIWVDNLEENDKDKNRWDKAWIEMFKKMAGNPGLIWSIRPAFGGLKTRFEEILLESKTEITKISASFLGAFLDMLCEAVFDKAKQGDQEKAQNSAQNEGAENA
ncbi:MAG: hypothetical protein IJU98_06215, partial [Synergistaceae bacterium]|nr:hypothetical protein [Synergistaceae bacterium]